MLKFVEDDPICHFYLILEIIVKSVIILRKFEASNEFMTQVMSV